MTDDAKHRVYDKTDWGDGPWMHEPDRLEFEHLGFPCLALRNHLGAWCGYVAVPPGHPAHKVEYQNVDGDISVHGGLTYSHECSGPICHVPKPGEPDDVWWFGFDCGHCWDLTPRMANYMRRVLPPDLQAAGDAARESLGMNEVYRDVDYVQAEIRRLAEQLSAMGPSGVTRRIALED